MPEYLAPGVYLEEMDASASAIPGVATSTVEAIAEPLRAAMVRVLKTTRPDWTDAGRHDPGITLIELFAFVTESLLARDDPVGEARRAAAAALFAGLASPVGGPCGPVVRPRYLAGQVLDAASLTAEQSYHRGKSRRHNLAFHGFGVVGGLGVAIDSGASPHVVVAPGHAVDPRGEEIAVCIPVTLAMPLNADTAFVCVRHFERPCTPAPQADGMAATRVEEACIVSISAAIPPEAVALARVVRQAGGWSLDPAFVVQRTNRAQT